MKYELYDKSIVEQDIEPKICIGCNGYYNKSRGFSQYCPNCYPYAQQIETNKTFSDYKLKQMLGE